MSRRRYNTEIIKQIVEGQNPFEQFGYKPVEVVRKIGDEWTDIKGISWRKILNGKIRVNKQMDCLRPILKRICKDCGQNIDFSCDKLDAKVFGKTSKCYYCLEKDEMALRVDGDKWAKYEKLKTLKNKLGKLKDFKLKVEEAIDYLKTDTGNMELVMSSGDIERWQGQSNPQWLKDAETDLVKSIEEIKKVEKELLSIDNNE